MALLELRLGKISYPSLAFISMLLWLQCPGTAAQYRQNSSIYYYICPPDFIRLGSSCYYLSDTQATWQIAHFHCQDRDSNLTAPARWEDRNLRDYLNRPEIKKVERWIGGIYDWEEHVWKWGGEMRKMRYQSFSKMPRMSPDELKWHCIAMVPEMLYRWAPRGCVEERHYVCQTRLLKVRRNERNRLRRKWMANGQGSRPNEVAVPHNNAASHASNAAPAQPARRPQTVYRREQRKRKKPFAGYVWDHHDPEAAYRHNLEVLNSGKTGLSREQIDKHLRRLERIRNKQLLRRKRLQSEHGTEELRTNEIAGREDDWLSDSPRADPHATGRRRQRKRKNPSPHRAVHKTYAVDNNISALHPKTIVEVHEFGNKPLGNA